MTDLAQDSAPKRSLLYDPQVRSIFFQGLLILVILFVVVMVALVAGIDIGFAKLVLDVFG